MWGGGWILTLQNKAHMPRKSRFDARYSLTKNSRILIFEDF